MVTKGIGFITCALLVLGMIATPAAAWNNRNFSFTMNERAVNGKDNGINHAMERGNMVLCGEVWAFNKDRVANLSPNQLTIHVMRDKWRPDVSACEAFRTPSNILNQRRSFWKDCGWEPTDDYYIKAWKVNDDGWNVQGSGQITTS